MVVLGLLRPFRERLLSAKSGQSTQRQSNDVAAAHLLGFGVVCGTLISQNGGSVGTQ
jgi:hypothetical protein